MAYLVRISIIVLVINFLSCKAKKKDEEVIFTTQQLSFDCGYDCELEDWLSDSVPIPLLNNSTPTWGFFYFTINKKGEVEKLRIESRLRQVVTDRIAHNIYRTKGHWKIPKDAPQNYSQLFVYPYFDFGMKLCVEGNCSKTDSIYQYAIINLAENLRSTGHFITNDGAKIISVKTRGISYMDM